MANMSYCRFENTEGDFADCLDAIIQDDLDNDSSAREKNSAAALYEMSLEYVREYEAWQERREEEEYDEDEDLEEVDFVPGD